LIRKGSLNSGNVLKMLKEADAVKKERLLKLT
jgi:hypothetical protein